MAGLAALTCWLAAGVRAQAPSGDVQAAARAFEQGQAAQLQEDWAVAAERFELADRLAPSAPALRSAIRNHLASGNLARAATLGLAALDRYPADATTRAVAEEALARADELLRIEVRCTMPCSLTIDGRAVSASAVANASVFVEPGSHRVEARWPDRDPVAREATGDAGAVARVGLEPPAPPEPEPAPVVEEPEPVVEEPVREAPAPLPMPPPEDEASEGAPAWVFFAGVGATAVVGVLALWSGLDTLSARDDYEAMPTREEYLDGVDRQRRTNVLFGVAAGLGIVTATLGVLWTDWGGREVRVAGARPLFWLAGGEAGVGVEGAL